MQPATVNGITLYIRPGNADDEAVMREMFQENVYQLHPANVAGQVVVDIGANIGAFSKQCLQLGAAHVISYEPEPHNWELLQRNVGGDVEAHNLAVSTKKEIRLSDDAGGSHQVKTGGTVCKAVTLDEVLEPLDHVGVLKIDIEGGEYDILTAASDQVLDKVAYLVLEYHNTDAQTFGMMIARLTKYFNLHFFGYYETGGMLYGRHY